MYIYAIRTVLIGKRFCVSRLQPVLEAKRLCLWLGAIVYGFLLLYHFTLGYKNTFHKSMRLILTE